MKKIFILFLIIIIATFLSSIYGSIHNQITYSISNEYFTKFKFIQFGLSEDYWAMGRNIGTKEIPEIKLTSPRLGATIVGIISTWWVGLIIGIILSLVGLIHNPKKMFFTTIKAFSLTIITALITGIIGLLYGKLFLTQTPPNWFLPKNIINTNNFIAVGSMHNFSYLGGLIGLFLAIIYSIKQTKSLK